MIEFSKYSDNFPQFTPNLMEDLKTYILENDDITIKTLIEFKVGEK